MPSKNRIKQYVPGAYYHLYNRGVEKRLIFLDEQDYGVFLGYLKLYLMPPEPFGKPHKDLSDRVELAAYCLMPNHFHLLVKQGDERGIESLMRCVITSYVLYFNRRYNRVGSLFQDIYKAVMVKTDAQLQQVEEYIHLNPKALIADVRQYPYSSLYWAFHPPAWLKPVVAQGRSLWQGSTLSAAAIMHMYGN
jgi:putative transposase